MLIYLQLIETDEDKQRFVALYEAYHVCAEQVALHMLKEPHDAEDAVQNTFLQIIRHFEKTYEIPCDKLRFWIISIVKNEAMMILRKKQNVTRLEDWECFSADADNTGDYNNLVALFSNLPETYRAVLELRFLAGYSGKEIAQCLGISETAVNTRVFRGRKLLQEIVEKEGFRL